MRIAALVVVLVGCGRFGFGSHDDNRPADARRDDSSGPGPDVATTCASANLVCDGFEGQFDAVWDLTDTYGGTLTLDPTRRYRGTTSAHVHTDPIGATAMTNVRAVLFGYPALPTAGTIYVRAWMYFASPFPSTAFDQIVNFANTAGQGISMGTRDTFLVANDYTNGVYKPSTSVALPLDRWTCVQFEMPSGVVGTTRVFIDGSEVTDVAITNTSAQPAPDHVYIGVTWIATLSNFPASDTWIDELVLDDKPTTCAQ